MKKKWIALLLLFVLVFPVGCGPAQNVGPETSIAGVSEEIIRPDDEDLAGFIKFLQNVNFETASESWKPLGGGYESLRTPQELFTKIVRILSTEPYTRLDEVPKPRPKSNANLYVEGLLSNAAEKVSPYIFSIELLKEDNEYGALAGQTLLVYHHETPVEMASTGSNAYLQPCSMRPPLPPGTAYLYPPETYDKLQAVLTPFVLREAIVLEGNYVATNIAKEKNGKRGLVLDALEIDDRIVALYSYDGYQPSSYMLDVLDAVTGKSVFSLVLEGDVRAIEKAAIFPYNYNYRILYSDRVEYRSSTNTEAVLTHTLAEEVRDYDADFSINQLAFGVAGEGIYLSDLDFNNKQLILSNADIPYDELESRIRGYLAYGSDLFYGSPLLMNGGRQLAATLYEYHMGYGDSEILNPVSVVVVDLTTGERNHLVDIQPHYPAKRVDEKTVVYILFQESAVSLLDVETMQSERVEYDYFSATSTDYCTVVNGSSPLRNDRGEFVRTDWVFKQETPEDKTTLLTITNGGLTVHCVMENYLIGVCYGSLNDETQKFIIVPY